MEPFFSTVQRVPGKHIVLETIFEDKIVLETFTECVTEVLCGGT